MFADMSLAICRRERHYVTPDLQQRGAEIRQDTVSDREENDAAAAAAAAAPRHAAHLITPATLSTAGS